MAKSKKKKVEPIHFEEKIEVIEEQAEINDKEIVVEAEPIDIEAPKETIIVTTTAPLNIREQKTKSSTSLGIISKGTSVELEYKDGDWGKLKDREGYINLPFTV